jgi:spore coat protein U-like protein
MKKLTAIAATVAIVAMAGSAMAATANLAVSANITASCSVTGGTLDFAALTGATVNANSQAVTVTCTNRDPYTVALNDGIHAAGTQKYLKNSSNTDTIAYSLTLPAGPYTGTGAAQNFVIAGTIADTAYATASAGTYNDTVQITVTP